MIEAYLDYQVKMAKTAWVHEQATVIGRVNLADDVSVWPQVVIRADINEITVGARSNVQDGSIIHVTRADELNQKGYSTTIGEDVTIGHRVMLHGCAIGNRVLVGMSSTILDGSIIEDDVIIGAGSLVAMNKVLESGYLYLGSPARRMRELTMQEKDFLKKSAMHYVHLKSDYAKAS